MDRLHCLHNRFANARAAHAACPDLVATYWRVVGLSSRPLVCALYRTSIGLTVRVGYEPDVLLRAQRVVSEDAGAAVAVIWKDATMSVGRFTDLGVLRMGDTRTVIDCNSASSPLSVSYLRAIRQ